MKDSFQNLKYNLNFSNKFIKIKNLILIFFLFNLKGFKFKMQIIRK